MHTIVVCLTLVFSLYVRAFAQPTAPATSDLPAPLYGQGANVPAPATECVSADLIVVPHTPSRPYRLSDTLSLRLRNGCLSQLRGELSKTGLDQSVTLYINSKPLPALPVELLEGEPPGTQVLAFALVRNPRDAVSRAAWDRLLGGESQADFAIVPALSIGRHPAVSATVVSNETNRFGVASGRTIFVAMLSGLVVFVQAFVALLKRPTTLRDEDGRFSLGKSQMAFWGLLVLVAVTAIWIVTGALEPLTDQVLILMGISAATGLGAVSIGANKRQQHLDSLQAELTRLTAAAADLARFQELGGQPRQAAITDEILSLKSAGMPSPMRKFFSDICDDGHGLSFHRLQAVLWTIILGSVFVWSVGTVMSMPTFDDSLLILMGISAGTYLGFKLPEQSDAKQ